MFELSEFVILARQMSATLAGKVIAEGRLGNAPHKFVWYNRAPAEFTALTRGLAVGPAHAEGKWLFVPLVPGYVLLFGECGGKLLYHAPGATRPAKFHLLLTFTDGAALSAMTQMWGAMELYAQGEERQRQYVRGMRPAPLDPAFTFEYFSALIAGLAQGEKRSAKGLLTQDQLIPGLGNALAQDILFAARVHPRHPVADLGRAQQRQLYRAIQQTVRAAIEQGGRSDEVDLFGQPGGYVRRMDKNAAGRPCPVCGHTVEKMQYLGGACYFCPMCQV
jgi:formamidopyrimidine-DNA glycosylase